MKTGSATYVYNGDEQMYSETTGSTTVTYSYDGDGRRVEKSGGTIYWYGMNDAALDETNLQGNLTNEYVFFGGKRIAMRNVFSGVIYYYAEDMLGSSRTIVQAGQTTPCYDGDFYPFGGERIITNTCSQNYKFEGKERDTESGNDDFGARYYSSRIGRWLSADWSSVPVPVPYANLTNPQTLNLYAMVSDNPETFADLDGHWCQITAPGNTSCKPDVPPPAPATTGEGHNSNNNPNCANASATCTSKTQQEQAQSASQQGDNQKNPGDQKNNDHGDQNQQQPDANKPPSWDPTKPLPNDPTKLGPDWKRDPDHKAPNDERYVNPNGDKLDWHKGVPGEKGWRGKDHWHWNEHDWHFRPGDTVRRTATLIAAGVVAYWIISETSRLFPPRNFVPVP